MPRPALPVSFLTPLLLRSSVFKRYVSSAPPPRRPRNLDMFAHFRRPASTPTIKSQDGPTQSTQLSDVLGRSTTLLGDSASPSAGERAGGKVKAKDSFVTSASAPAGPSLQETLPPSAQPTVEETGTKVVLPLPAMKDVPASATSSDSERGRTRTREMVVQGVAIPPKPRPPGEEECCMSGCVHCVYTIYADELEIYTTALDQARKALITSGQKEDSWPEEIRESGSGAEVKADAQERVEVGMDPSMSAFLALENKLKKK